MIDVCCAFSRFGIVFFIVISPCFLFLRRQFGDVSRPWWKPNQSPLPWQSFNKPGNWPSPRTKLPRWHFCRHFPLCAGEGSSGKWCFFFSNLFLVFLGGSRCLSFVYESKALPCWKSPTEFWARLTSRSKSRWRLKTSRRFVCLSKCFCKAETKKDKGIDAVQLLAQFLFLEGVPMMVNQIRGVGLSPKTFPKLDRLTRVGSFFDLVFGPAWLTYYMIYLYMRYLWIYIYIHDDLWHIDTYKLRWPPWKNVRCFTSFKNPWFSTQGWLHCCSSFHGTLDHCLDGGQCGLHGALYGHRGGRDGRGRHTRPWEDGRFPGFHGARKTKHGIYWKALHGQLQQKLNQLWRLRHRWEKLGRSQDTCWPTRCWVEPTLIFTGEICLDLRHRLWSHQNQLWLCCNWKHPGAHHGLVARSHQWNDIMISWYQRPNIYAWHAKKNHAKDQEAANIHQNPALRKPYVHSFDMVFTDRTAGLKISHREEEWTSRKAKQNTFEMGEVDTNFLSTKLRIFTEETLDSHRLRCCS